MRWRAALVGVLALVAACGGGGSPATTVPTGPQPLNDDQAARLAQSGFLNAQSGGARFEANSAFLVGEPRETVSLVGEVDWKRHVGRALVRTNGADASLTEVYWERDVLLERRPAMDVLVAARGGPEQAWIARSPDPSGRQVDRLVALVMALASEQPDNALLIQQTEGSSFIRADELRGAPVEVLRYGTRNLHWLAAADGNLMRFEGNSAGGTAPTIIDLIERGPVDIPAPPPVDVVAATDMAELYQAFVGR